jgi:hypothetical protein
MRRKKEPSRQIGSGETVTLSCPEVLRHCLPPANQNLFTYAVKDLLGTWRARQDSNL